MPHGTPAQRGRAREREPDRAARRGCAQHSIHSGSKQKYWMADGSGTVRICWAWENEVDYTEGRCLNDGCSCEWGGFKELVDDLIDTDPLYD